MKKHFLAAGLFLTSCLLFPVSSFAQFTTVTATVKDSNGIPYAGAVLNAVLVPSVGGGYTLGGQPYSGRIGPVTLDSTGSFTVNFGDVTRITPGSPQWQITIDSAAATIALSLGTGPQTFTFTSTGTTISGSSPVSLTTALNALAPKLTNFAGAGTGTIAGTVTASHIPYANGANSLADIAGSAVIGGTGAIALTAGADTTVPITINGHSATQTGSLLTLIDNSSDTCPSGTVLCVMGNATGVLSQVYLSGSNGGTGNFPGILMVNTDIAGSNGFLNLGATTGTNEMEFGVTATGGAVTGGFGAIPDATPTKVDDEMVADLITWRNTGGASTVKGSINPDTGVITTNSDTIHPNLIGQAGNTTLPAIIPNDYNWAGPPITTYVAWEDQPATSTSGGPPGHSFKNYPAVGGSPLSSQWFWTVITNCPDTGGNHLNYTQSTDLFSCGTSSGGAASVVLVPATTAANTIAPTANGVVGLTVLGTTGTGTPHMLDVCTNSAGACGTNEFNVDSSGNISSNGHLTQGANLGISGTGLILQNFGVTGVRFTANAAGVAQVDSGSGSISRLMLGFDNSSTPGFCPSSANLLVGVGGANCTTLTNLSAAQLSGQTYASATNCSSSASPAVCGSAAAGSVALPTNAVSSSIVVNTTAVTANSQIFVQSDDTLGTKLGITCNSTIATLVGGLTISARTAGTSFTIANNVAVVTNPLCVSYHIIN